MSRTPTRPHCRALSPWAVFGLLLTAMLLVGFGALSLIEPTVVAEEAVVPLPPIASTPAPMPATPPPAPGQPAPAERETAAPTGSSAPVVCIDPGHPSETSDGTRAADGTTENHINWLVALKLRDLLTLLDYRVVLTKNTEDERVTNRRRAEIANAAGAALLLRLHCDTGAGSGFALYYPDRPGRSGGDVGPPETVCGASGQAALVLHDALNARLGRTLVNNGIKTDLQTAVGARQGALTGSVYARVPAVTVEMVFLSDPANAAWISDPANQQTMAEALAEGVDRWVSQ